MNRERIDLQTLEIFLEVSEDCSMTHAAKRLNVTQAAVSSAILRLEKEFNTKLFDRSTRPMNLTMPGRVLRRRSVELMEAYNLLLSDVLSSRKTVKPDLRLGYSDSISNIFAPHIVPKLINEVNYFVPIMGLTPHISELLLAQKLDIGIGSDPLLSHKGVQNIPLYTENFLLLIPSSYDSEFHSLGDIYKLSAKLPLIRYNQYCYSQIEVERILKMLRISTQGRIEADTNAMILQLVSNGLGWSIVPALAILHEKGFYKNITAHKINSPVATRLTYIIYTELFYENLANFIAVLIKKFIREDILPRMKHFGRVVEDSISVL